MTYSVTSLAYLLRAQQRLDCQTSEDLFYAAFELRAGVEARMQEYIEPHDHIPKKRKVDYHIARLGRTTDKVSLPNDQVMRYGVYTSDGHPVVDLYYTPVSRALRGYAERLGALLHAMVKFRDRKDPWWTHQRALLDQTFNLLVEANVGTLMGAATLNRDTGVGQMTVVVPAAEKERISLIKGQRITAKVQYLKRIPDAEVRAFATREKLRYPRPDGA